MSEAGHGGREWRFYVQDMIEFCGRVSDYTAGLDQTIFFASKITYDATLRNLELIGEAATHVPEEVRDRYPDIPWGSIIGAQNQLAHGYMRMDENLVWTMIEDGIPSLLPQLQNLLLTETEDST